MSSLDYLDLCRLCLVKDRVSVPIFDGEGDVRQIFLKIAACLPVKVEREDKLPKKICDDCVYKVELFYQFWNTTANAEKQLLQWLGEVGGEGGGKQGYVSNALNPNVMKQEQSTENRLDGNVMQQVSEHQNNMGMGMMDNMGLGIPMMLPNTNQQQQITSVPMDTSGSSAQTVQAVPGPSSQTTHNQISQNQTSSTQQEDEEESSEDEENSDDECDGDEGLPVKEESEEDPNSRTIEPTTFVNVSLACDEAGPSGLQQQKIADMPEMPMPQSTDGDPKTGISTIADTRNPVQPLFVDCKGNCTSNYDREPIRVKAPPVFDEEEIDVVYTYVEKRPPLEDYESNINGDPGLRISNYCSLSNDVYGSSLFNKVPTEVNNDTAIDIVKEDPCATAVVSSTMLVPIIDPVTREIKNSLVPHDVTDEAGKNIIKSVLVPLQTPTGDMCYEVKKILVPIDIGTYTSPKCKTDTRNTNKGKRPVKERMILPKPIPVQLPVNVENPQVVEKQVEQAQEIQEEKQEEETKEVVQDEPAIEKKPESEEVDEVDMALEQIRNTCPLCEMSFKTAQQMERHYRRKHENQFRCSKCHRTYSSEVDLKTHSEVHKKDTYVECNVCHRKYKRKNRLIAHQIREHTTVDPKSLGDKQKEECNPVSNTYGAEAHWGPQMGPRTYTCTSCKKVYPRKSYLVAHERIAHGIQKEEDKEKAQCEICNKVFKNKRHLERHNSVHGQGLLCSVCGKRVSNPHSLRLHMLRHEGNRDHPCKVCLKSFTTSVSLRVHELTHLGLRPYKCDICKRSFTQRSSMMVHRKKHPGNLPPPPPLNLREYMKMAKTTD